MCCNLDEGSNLGRWDGDSTSCQHLLFFFIEVQCLWAGCAWGWTWGPQHLPWPALPQVGPRGQNGMRGTDGTQHLCGLPSCPPFGLLQIQLSGTGTQGQRGMRKRLGPLTFYRKCQMPIPSKDPDFLGEKSVPSGDGRAYTNSRVISHCL